MMLDFTHWKTRLLDVLFPPVCAVCHARLTNNPERSVCDRCVNDFKVPDSFTCPDCRGRIPFLSKGLPLVASLCHPKAGYLLLSCSFYDYPPTKSLIGQLKFERRTGIAIGLGQIAARALASSGIASDFSLTPIPLAAARLRDRGFNQAELIANEVIKSFPGARYIHPLERTKNTEAQSHLKDWGLRKKNLQGVFTVRGDEELRARQIVLIDDVWTSGATMNDAVRALREKGAGRIIGLVIGRIR